MVLLLSTRYSLPNPQVFTILDDKDGDVVTVPSFTNIAKNWCTIQHTAVKVYVCQEGAKFSRNLRFLPPELVGVQGRPPAICGSLDS